MKHFGRKLKAYSFVLLIVGVTVSSYVYTLIATASSVSLFFLFYGLGEIVSKLSAIAENTSGTRRAMHYIRRYIETSDDTEEPSAE